MSDEKAYCVDPFLVGLKMLVAATRAEVVLRFTVDLNDVETPAALKAAGYGQDILPLRRVKNAVPKDHSFNSSYGEMIYMNNIANARNILRVSALCCDVDYLFSLDADGLVDPQAINKMIVHAESGLLAVTTLWAQRLFDLEANPLTPRPLLGRYPEPDQYWEDIADVAAPIVKAGHAFGGVLFSRCLLDREIEFRAHGRSVIYSEDYNFFLGLLDADLPFGIDHTIKTHHMCIPSEYPSGYVSDGRVMPWADFLLEVGAI